VHNKKYLVLKISTGDSIDYPGTVPGDLYYSNPTRYSKFSRFLLNNKLKLFYFRFKHELVCTFPCYVETVGRQTGQCHCHFSRVK
jgi:hypothetical protein